MTHTLSLQLKIAAVVLPLLVASTSHATWSIVIADSDTKEVAVGTVTCLTNYDLLAIVPVVVVGKGAAAVQAAGDFSGLRRPIIRDNLSLGTSPEEILAILSGVSGHEERQYGIADTEGRMVTFSGTENYQWAGGVVGNDGSMVYAIQGNILAGGCVVPAIEEAVLTTTGDFPEKLMAGMQAARQEGGDGRCSCSQFNPTACGCPPGSFTKSGHIGGMVLARIGDTDDPICDASGCVDGDYYMRLNVAYQAPADPDPVVQLQSQFDAWRSGLTGRPDAIQTIVEFDPDSVPPDSMSSTTMNVMLLDWQGEPIDVPISALTVTHSGDSDSVSQIGSVTDNGDGTFSVAITAGIETGVDRFTVTVDDGTRPVILMPEPALPVTWAPIPTVSTWALAVMTLLMLTTGVLVLRRKVLA